MIRKIWLAVLLVATFIGNVDVAHGGVGLWTSNGPEGQSIYALAIDPATPTTLYAGSGSGVFKSTNGGANWSAINTGLTFTWVNALAIDPATPTTLYAGSGSFGGVYKSTNGGASWSAINTGLTSKDIQALAINPATPTTLYAGSSGGGVFAIQQVTFTFTFVDVTSVPLSTVQTSNAITVSGISAPATIAIVGGEYELNSSGTWSSSAGTVANGNTVRVRHTSAATYSTAVNTTLTIGGISDTFTSTTLAAPISFTLTVTPAGTGTGKITGPGLDCGADCQESYAAGTSVPLSATADPDSVFSGFSGDADCADGILTMNADKHCTATFTVTGVGPPIVSTPSMPAGEQGAAYWYVLQAEGGTPPYTWSLGGGKKNKLPQGLTLTSDGILGGIPTKAKTATFTVQVIDATGASATKQLSLQIVKGVKFKTKLGKGKVGTPYSAALKATGGIAPLTFSLIGGALPPGLTLDPATGQISGTPAAAGTFNFEVRVASNGGSSDQKGMRIKVK